MNIDDYDYDEFDDDDEKDFDYDDEDNDDNWYQLIIDQPQTFRLGLIFSY